MNSGSPTRIEAIDLARGMAVSLMILSHGIKGLLSFEQFPDWGLVPIHLITKFSSTIFFLVFGLTLAVVFAPATQDSSLWPQKRKKLFTRGLIILFWYKILTIIEMSHLHRTDEILDALLYLKFPSYAEILDFYALALLWIPFLLPFWQKSSLFLKACFPLFFALLTYLLTEHLDFGIFYQVKALLIEEDGLYTWGQLSRAPFVFLGMFIGHYYTSYYQVPSSRIKFSGLLALVSILIFAAFLFIYKGELYLTFFSLAENVGKHPPQMPFILFSLSGALATISFTTLIGDKGAKWLTPITLIGKETLSAFVFHLTILFLVYRLFLGLWLDVTYPQALALTILLFVLTAGWAKFRNWRKKHEKSKVLRRSGNSPRGLVSHEFKTN
ncbi:acyltransferase family protein [Peredibacter sp. HCB2-198]|uniref:acyltransferase family protein n=1 Tax=Peredibacter sp. HCB2-198 TaxID=3383025 RepID=UPI0038B4416B